MRKVAMCILFAMILAFNYAGAAEKNIPVYGNWHGEFTNSEWQDRTIRAQIVGESRDTYRAVLYVGEKGQDEKRVEVRGKTQKKVTHFEGPVDLGSDLGGAYIVTADLRQGRCEGQFKGEGSNGQFVLERVVLRPPTLGKEPPAGAIVLFDGTEESLDQNWHREDLWRRLGDGSFGPRGISCWTKDKFGDGEYHVEFKTAYMPNERGQGRSNSGVYICGTYEIQVLDSFADFPANNLCGGLYSIATPIVNACLPPEEWQTYDITFRAARFDENGKKIKNAELHVVHNGKVIHDNLVLPKATPGGLYGNKEMPEGELLLQFHGDYLSFKNIWVKPLN